MYDGVAFEYSGGCPEQDKNVVVVFASSQKNIQEELASIFGHSDRTVTLEDVNRMYYLERVIKETMRLFPPVPFIRRSVDEDIELGKNGFSKFVFPFRVLTGFLGGLERIERDAKLFVTLYTFRFSIIRNGCKVFGC
jgi:hypothetical protein